MTKDPRSFSESPLCLMIKDKELIEEFSKQLALHPEMKADFMAEKILKKVVELELLPSILNNGPIDRKAWAIE